MVGAIFGANPLHGSVKQDKLAANLLGEYDDIPVVTAWIGQSTGTNELLKVFGYE